MALKQKGTDSAAAAADPKKRRPVGFSGIDGKVISNDASIDQDLADQLKIFELILFKLGK
uniref:Uncharacterized protein n=1 Tax=Leersia perrieri TaxID=77586 RepID=A0A0D9XRB8_9ORYZ